MVWGFAKTDFEDSYRDLLAEALRLRVPLDEGKVPITAIGLRNIFTRTKDCAKIINEAIDAEAQRQNLDEYALKFTAIIEGKPYVCYRTRVGQLVWAFSKTDISASYRDTLAEDLKLPVPLEDDKVAISANGLSKYFSSSQDCAKIINEAIDAEAQRQNLNEYAVHFTAIIAEKEYACYRRTVGAGVGCWAFSKSDIENFYQGTLAEDLKLRVPLGEDKVAVAAGPALHPYFTNQNTVFPIINEKINAEAQRQKIGEYQIKFTAIIEGKPYLCFRGTAGSRTVWGFLKTDLEASYRDTLAEDLKLKVPLRNDKVALSASALQPYFIHPHNVARVINEKIEAEAQRQNIGEHQVKFTALIEGKKYVCFKGTVSTQTVWGFEKNDVELYFNALSEDFRFTRRSSIDFRQMSTEAIKNFIGEHSIETLITMFSNKPYFGKILSVLRTSTFAGSSISAFMPRVVELETGIVLSYEGGRPELSQEERTAYIQALLAAYQTHELDLSERGLAEATRLLIRISRVEFEQNPELLVKDLYDKANTYQNNTSLNEEARCIISDLHTNAANHFERVLSRRNMLASGGLLKSALYPYQPEGVEHLVEKERAVLAYGTGLGKTVIAIAAVEVLAAEAGRPMITLWITTNENREKVKREIFKHTHLDPEQHQARVEIIVSGNVKERARQLDRIAQARWRIVNYEQLVALYQNYPKEYAKLMSEVDVVVGDEAHRIGNIDAWQSMAVRDIKSQYAFLLSATPCKNQLEEYYPLFNFLYPDRFPSVAAFRDMYTRTVEGVQQLQADVEDIVLYRSPEEALPFFIGPESIPAIPKKTRLIRPDELLTYDMLPESFKVIEEILANFSSWRRSSECFPGDRKNGTENPLWIYSELLQASYLTKRYHIKKENPIWSVVDPVVNEAVRTGKKLNIWAFHRELISGMEERYKAQHFRRLDGTVTRSDRRLSIDNFNDEDEVAVLGASRAVGGEGLDLYADEALFLEPPPTIQRLLQVEGRNVRVLGPDNAAYGRKEILIRFAVPTYPKRLLNQLTNPKVRRGMEPGSLPQRLVERLAKGELLHRWLLEGGDPKDAEVYFKASILEAMGLTKEEQNSTMEPVLA